MTNLTGLNVNVWDFIRSLDDISPYIAENGNIDMVAVQDAMDKMNKSKLLEQHPYAITRLANRRWQTFLPADGKSKKKQIRRVNRDDLESVVVAYYIKKNTVHTIKKTAYEWLEFKASEPGFKRSSFDRYENNYLRIFDGYGETNVSKLSEFDLEDYLIKRIIEKQITYRAWSDIKIVIKGIFKYAKRHQYTDIAIDDVLDYIDSEKKIFAKPRTKNDSDEVFTEDEVRKIEDYIDKRQKISLVDLGIKLALRTGLRAGELAALKYSDLDMNTCAIRISRTEQHSKNETGHIEYYFSDEGTLKCEHPAEDLYVDKGAIELIQEINDRYPESDFLFYDGHFIRSQAFSKRLCHICNTIGIKPRTLHKARKTYATRLINAGVDQMLVKTQLRHKDITTTLKHYYRDNKSAAEKAAKIEAVLSAY
ncbi:MAG: site-specific integrase [Lachnospiraceae bacterium]|nr:site-specific integrase [Lachnospiraceae bacterium]